MRIQIYGERHTGSSWLANLISKAFVFGDNTNEVQNNNFYFSDFGWKHWTPPLEKIKSSSDCIFVAIFRDPYNWLEAMHRKPWHATPAIKALGFIDFTQVEWMTIDDEDGLSNSRKEIMEDHNPFTGERFKNLFELRKIKTNYFLDLKEYVENYYPIRYEDLIGNPTLKMQDISLKFKIKMKNNFTSGSDLSKKLPVDLSSTAQNLITENIDWETESRLGYEPRLIV